MSRALPPTDFVVTKEHRRFAEFCDACRRYRYIGVCYGPPGVGKTLSARSYAHWDRLTTYRPYEPTPVPLLAELVQCSHTVFYTPKVVNSPREVEQAIARLRRTLHDIHLEPIRQEETARRQELQGTEQKRRHYVMYEHDRIYEPPPEPLKPNFAEIATTYEQKRQETPDPTSLIIVDEADRLKMAALEQVRDIFDQGGVGVVLIGMPGMEKRLARYPQLYSRVGFVHAFRPLSATEVRMLLQDNWTPAGVSLPRDGGSDEEAVAAIIRISGGNFRLLHRLLTQIARLVEINTLKRVTREAVEAARESLVIGTA